MRLAERAPSQSEVRIGYRTCANHRTINDDTTVPVLLLGGGPGMRGDYLAPLVYGASSVHPVAVDPALVDIHGIALPAAGLSFDAQVCYLADAVARIGATRVWLVGHSFGARLALAFAAAYPEHTAGIVLISASASPLRMPLGVLVRALPALWQYRRKHRQASNEEAFLAAYPQATVRYYYGTRKPSPSWIETFRSSFVSEPFWAALMASALTRADLRKRARTITCPALLIHGGRDRLIPVKRARDLSKRLQRGTGGRARLIVISKAGHMVPVEEQSACMRAIADFIVAHESRLTP